MPTTSDPEKAYVKKYKINDILNELFLSLKEKKPDDPINFAYNHFKSKMPPEAVNTNEPNLLTRLFNKQQDVLNTSHTTKASSLRVLSTLQIVSKVDRVLAQNMHKETSEDLLENEMIVNYTSGKNETETESKKVFKYKNAMDRKVVQNRHRKDLEKLLNDEIAKKFEQKTVETDSTTINRAKPEDYELLFDELKIDDGSKFYRPVKDELNKVKERKIENKAGNMNRMSRFLSFAAPASPRAIFVCEICGKAQLEGLPKEKEEKTDKEALNGLLSHINPVIGKQGINEIPDEEKLKLSQAANNIFDLLHLSDKKDVILDGPVTVKDTARTNGTNGDDDFIESASQVSGPVILIF